MKTAVQDDRRLYLPPVAETLHHMQRPRGPQARPRGTKARLMSRLRSARQPALPRVLNTHADVPVVSPL